jgi:hypothetical protein
MQDLMKNFTINNQKEVEKLLKEHKELRLVLEEAPRKIQHYFHESELVLGFFEDSYDETNRVFMLLIRTDLNPYDAFTQMKNLRINWWHEARSKVDGLLKLDVEFVNNYR